VKSIILDRWTLQSWQTFKEDWRSEEGGFPLSLSLSMCSFSRSRNQRRSLLAPLIREYDCHSEQQTDCCKGDETVKRDGDRTEEREREREKTNKAMVENFADHSTK
jgi:hypothetical protein